VSSVLPTGKGSAPKAGAAKPGGAQKGSAGGGLLSRLPFGKKDDKVAAAKPGAPGSGVGSGPRPPGTPSASAGSSATSTGKKPIFGSAGGASQPGTVAKPSAATAKPTGIRRFLPFLGGQEKKAVARQPKPSKAPKVENEGLSLDRQLDIIGVVLVLGSLALFFSSMSTTKGQLTGGINNFLAQTFGWGAIFIPVAMLVVGVWLLVRHFGDEAPVVPMTRIIGVVMLYIALLYFLQFIDSFSYRDLTSLRALHDVWLPIAVARGSGGGLIGAQLYYFLIVNLTEPGAFISMVGLLILGVMLTASLSAAEMAVIMISVARSFNASRQRRVQRRAAQAAASLAAQQALQLLQASQQVTVGKPAAEALPAPVMPALPTPTPEPAPALPEPPKQPERAIPITIGGRTVTAITGGDLMPVGPLTTPQAASSPPAKSPEPTGEKQSGGIAARLRLPLPGGGKAEAALGATPASGKTEPDKSGLGIRDRLFGKATSAAAPTKPGETPSAKPTPTVSPTAGTPPATVSASLTPSATPVVAAKPDETRSPTTPISGPPPKPAFTTALSDDEDEDDEPVRLGDLVRPTPPKAASAPPASTSVTATPPKPAVDPAAGMAVTPSGTPANPRPFAAGADKPAVDSPAKPASAEPQRPAASVQTDKPAANGPKSFSAEPARPMTDEVFKVVEPTESDEDDEGDLEDERLANLPPAKPRGTGPLPRPQDTKSRFGVSIFGAGKPDAKPNPLAERQERLNAIRAGHADVRPEDMELDDKKPAASAVPVSKPAPERAAPSAPPPAAQSEPEKPAANAANAAAVNKPAIGPLSPEKPAVAEKPAAVASPVAKPAAPTAESDDKAAGFTKPQPAPAFWNNSAAPAATAKPGSETHIPTPSPAFGRPSGLPGAPPTAATPSPAAESRPVAPTAPTVVSSKKRKEWRLPNQGTLLMPGSEQDFDRGVLLQKARVIEETLQSFGAPGKVVEVNTGPVITQFAVEPEYLVTRGGKKNRVKVSAIAQLDKDLQLALGAKSIRIEAPVPGKGYVGIEVPNDKPALVSLRDVMESQEFQRIKSPLTIALGQSVDGTPVAADLSGMPHLLIAGTTGSGKSVCVNAVITSLVLRNPPDRLKFIMVDPKRVELTGYNGIPHLVAPVVVELERIVGVLKWVTREMDERYKRFSNAGARNIEDFNRHLKPGDEIMPYIIVIIDELADLMMLAPDETERVVTRIAALARATGIHLVIATQRPSVDVVTGLIKANFPARIAFAVASGVDSKVILDQPGAERLLGRGDMLFMSGDSPAPVRLQGVFVSDTEITNITRFWKAQITEDDSPARPISQLVLDNTVVETSRSVAPSNERSQVQQQAFWDRDASSASSSSVVSSSAADDDYDADQDDDLYEEAVEMVRRLNKASVSLLQRRLRIGYTRAARLIDRMEEEGIVGPATEGSKPREVLPLRD
jgi:DNA segregation ATPase FtsK/SpoIIIE-like protein